MSSPFSGSSPIGKPSWSPVPANSGNFAPTNATGGTNIPEVGYGEGGYGEDGYDAPSIFIPAAALTPWTIVSANNGNFAPINVAGGTNVPEVGYGEGGYGEDGYDAPGIFIPAAASTQWALYATK